MAEGTLNRHIEMRAYDETAGTRNYTVLTMHEIPDMPMRTPIPDTTTYLPGGRSGADDILHYIASEEDIYAPIPLSITFTIDNEQIYILDSLGNPREISPWSIAGTTFEPVTVPNIGTRDDSEGNAIAMPGPAHKHQQDHMFDLEIGHHPPTGGGGSLIVTRLLGVAIKNANWGTDAERTTATLDLEVYGAIISSATAFTAGAALHH